MQGLSLRAFLIYSRRRVVAAASAYNDRARWLLCLLRVFRRLSGLIAAMIFITLLCLLSAAAHRSRFTAWRGAVSRDLTERHFLAVEGAGWAAIIAGSVSIPGGSGGMMMIVS